MDCFPAVYTPPSIPHGFHPFCRILVESMESIRISVYTPHSFLMESPGFHMDSTWGGYTLEKGN